MALHGSERKVLNTILREGRAESAGYVTDSQIAHISSLTIEEVRDCLETLEGKECVQRSRGQNGFSAYITAKGCQELRLSLPVIGDGGGEPAKGPPKVVPKGLRSYDEDDTDFFLDLLPPPRRADGLPEIIHFWKTRIEETNPDKTFRVGVIYGPSGCGKSSLVKAGLLPRLPDHVLRVYVEATAIQTESHLLKGIRRQCPDLPPDLGLVESLAALHQGKALPPGKKVLLVLDQFEQWLLANRGREGTELVKAFGRGDEERVQVILVVRDDFWIAITWFMEEIGTEIRTSLNARPIDLFTPSHAQKVLVAFGQAYGALPDGLATEQQEFITQAVKALALSDNMIVPVRLALFVEIFKSRGWTTETLKEIGDAKGVGVAFLEQKFGSSYADARHRSHQEAAPKLLRALLPEGGTEIKRPRRPWRELLDASGYASQPKEFEDLLRILERELFLITPIDREGRRDDHASQASGAGERYYQLTHDYLVPSLREWLTNKDQEASQLVDAIRMAETHAVPPLVEQLANLRLWADSKLHRIIDNSGVDSKEHLHASLALLPVDEGQVEYLYRRLLKAGPTELSVLRDALKPYRERLVERLWSVLEQPEDEGQCLQAASAMALYDPSNPRWQEVGGKVAQAMVTVNAVHLGTWRDALILAETT